MMGGFSAHRPGAQRKADFPQLTAEFNARLAHVELDRSEGIQPRRGRPRHPFEVVARSLVGNQHRPGAQPAR